MIYYCDFIEKEKPSFPFFFLLEGEPGRVVGTGMIAFSKWKENYAVARIAVEEGFRLRGISRAIVERRLEEARKMVM